MENLSLSNDRAVDDIKYRQTTKHLYMDQIVISGYAGALNRLEMCDSFCSVQA
jgi:hypothetical protein